MTRKLLQWMGVLFALGLVGAAVGGLAVLKDRIRLIVQLDQTAAGPDPVALVRDDVQVIQRELGELRTALGGNFEQLGTALEERAEARHATVQKLGVDLTSVQQAQATTRAELGRLLVQLDRVDQRLALVAEAAALAAAKAVPAIDRTPAVPVVVVPPTEPRVQPAIEPTATATADSPTVTPLAQAEPPAVHKKPGFLSFSVPDTKFQFTEPQDYALAADLCRVGFDAKSTLHDFTGATAKVAGQFRADFDDPNGAFRGEVTCEVKSLVTGVAGRDTNMLEHLDAEHQPQIRFTIARFVPTEVDAEKMTASGVIHGRMTIRGKSREVGMPVKVSVDPSKRVAIEGQMPLKLSDYEIPVPSQLGGTITMQDEVNVWIALRARVMVGGRK